jgi:PAS domain S-box-containing protein
MTLKADQSSRLRRNLELVVQTGLLLARNLDRHSLAQLATDAGLQLCEAQFGGFYNATSTNGSSSLLYMLSGADREKFTQPPLPCDPTVLDPTFGVDGIVRSGDITRDPRYAHIAPYFGMPQGRSTVHSYLAVPVKGQTGEVLGALYYGHEDINFFGQDSEDLVASIAAQAAIAMENLRLREQLTRKAEEAEKATRFQREIATRVSEVAAIVESSDDAIISKDLTGEIKSWNQAAARIFGYSREEIVGSSILRLIPEELHDEEKTIIAKIKAGERIDHFETVRVTKAGDRLDVSLSISPIMDDTGTIVGASKILRDVSAKKRTEASLIQAEKIAAAGRMAATIAHEVNNPLEAVMNLIYLAKSNAEDPDQVRTFLNTAEGEITRVSHIARQTLGFYRENASPIGTTLSELVRQAVKIYSPKCTTAGIVIKENLDSNRKVVVRKGEMMQVISNLIANSIYAMPSGGTLSISTKDTNPPDNLGVVLTVADNGVGIPENQLPRIFDAFFSTRSAIGTGIGLFVAKQFVESHKGKIHVETSTDPVTHGTRMSVFVPFEEPHSEDQETPA